MWPVNKIKLFEETKFYANKVNLKIKAIVNFNLSNDIYVFNWKSFHLT